MPEQEQQPSLEHVNNKPSEALQEHSEAAQKHLDKLQADAQEAANQAPDKEALDELGDAAESKAKAAHETPIDQADQLGDGGLSVASVPELKKQSYDRKLQQVRGQLSGPERSFSKLVHQSTVNSVSEMGARTVFRASGVLGGSLAALIGSGILLYLSKHYGFSYNYLLFAFLFVGGFFVGLLIELLGRLFHKRQI